VKVNLGAKINGELIMKYIKTCSMVVYLN
jgi:hypothetical protein